MPAPFRPLAQLLLSLLLLTPLAPALAGSAHPQGDSGATSDRSGPDLQKSLEPLRQAIDQRLLLAEAVARAKWNVQGNIEDLPREALVIQAAVRQGGAMGLPAAWIESVFRAQIEASKTVQRELFAKWQTQQAGHFADAPDLANTIRPALDRITTQILRSMADNQAIVTDPARQTDIARAMQPLQAATLSPAAAAQALAPFAAQH
ncbi:chorismate mutase-like protein [Duganella sp. 1224]|uniref:gamma subclass chorismate mutase AroQ n=1 Tax=Duganella sp. 1224 TaxID=2587052 RepID=UPI0015CE0381|nr:gamma subclass chorismate mutase AroQ [Duganella sp. 1224]NYE60834.1 chorismate mutase-like protein [Duganella sp. 1224]